MTRFFSRTEYNGVIITTDFFSVNYNKLCYNNLSKFILIIYIHTYKGGYIDIIIYIFSFSLLSRAEVDVKNRINCPALLQTT